MGDCRVGLRLQLLGGKCPTHVPCHALPAQAAKSLSAIAHRFPRGGNWKSGKPDCPLTQPYAAALEDASEEAGADAADSPDAAEASDEAAD